MTLASGRVVFALSGFAALAVALTGALLLWRYREATLEAAADREAILLRARAEEIGGELGALEREIGRLSRLAEVDLADGNLEPEKTVLRAARRDSALFSASIAILDRDGEVAWAEPEGARPQAAGSLVALARDRSGPVVRFGPGEIAVAAKVAGQGAIVGFVGGGRDLFGPELRRALRERGAVALVLPGSGDDLVVAEARAGPTPPALRLGGAGRAWLEAPGGERWLVAEHTIPPGGLVLRLVLSAAEVEGELSGPFRRLLGLVGAALALALAGGLSLAFLVRRLERAEVELARSRDLAAMGKTAAAIAHEVKNALNGLSVATDLLAGGRVNAATGAEVHRRARGEIARLRDVADDLTLFAATPRLVLGRVDVAALCHDAARGVAELAEDSEVSVAVDADGPVPARADPGKLLGVLVNLARNGIEAMGPGGFGEALGEPAPPHGRRLEIVARREAGCAVIEVADRGPGIAREVRARLFEPFVTTKRTGTGLGLAIVRRVVEAHGGAIEAIDRPGGGTVFRLTLPAEEAA